MKTATLRTIHFGDEDRPPVQYGIPIPKKRSGPLPTYVIDDMEVGGSRFFPGRTRAPTTVYERARKLGFRLESRRIGAGVRVWSVA